MNKSEEVESKESQEPAKNEALVQEEASNKDEDTTKSNIHEDVKEEEKKA